MNWNARAKKCDAMIPQRELLSDLKLLKTAGQQICQQQMIYVDVRTDVRQM